VTPTTHLSCSWDNAFRVCQGNPKPTDAKARLAWIQTTAIATFLKAAWVWNENILAKCIHSRILAMFGLASNVSEITIAVVMWATANGNGCSMAVNSLLQVMFSAKSMQDVAFVVNVFTTFAHICSGQL
jgi:hypothetical protein